MRKMLLGALCAAWVLALAGCKGGMDGGGTGGESATVTEGGTSNATASNTASTNQDAAADQTGATNSTSTTQ